MMRVPCCSMIRGEMWDGESRRLADALEASLSGDELLQLCREESRLRRRHRDATASPRIRLRPAIVSPIAFSALLYWLHDRASRSRLISFLDGEWSHEMVGSREDAVSTAAAALELRHGRIARAISCKCRARCTTLPRSSPLRAVLNIWSEMRRQVRPRASASAAEKALNGRFVLVEAQPAQPTSCIKDIGSGLAQARASTGCRARSACGSRTSPTTPTASGSPALSQGADQRRARASRTSTPLSTGRSSRARASATGGCCCRSTARATQPCC